MEQGERRMTFLLDRIYRILLLQFVHLVNHVHLFPLLGGLFGCGFGGPWAGWDSLFGMFCRRYTEKSRHMRHMRHASPPKRLQAMDFRG